MLQPLEILSYSVVPGKCMAFKHTCTFTPAINSSGNALLLSFPCPLPGHLPILIHLSRPNSSMSSSWKLSLCSSSISAAGLCPSVLPHNCVHTLSPLGHIPQCMQLFVHITCLFLQTVRSWRAGIRSVRLCDPAMFDKSWPPE